MPRADNGWHRTSPATEQGNRARKREYNSKAYKQTRATVKIQVDAGHAHCWRCGRWLDPHKTWHLGHSDDRTTINGPECPPCNLRAAARAGNRARRTPRQTTPHPPTSPVRYR